MLSLFECSFKFTVLFSMLAKSPRFYSFSERDMDFSLLSKSMSNLGRYLSSKIVIALLALNEIARSFNSFWFFPRQTRITLEHPSRKVKHRDAQELTL